MPEEIFATEDDATHIYSGEVRDIISYRPNWIVRNGILLFLIIAIAVIGVTFFIEYPDIVIANAKLVSVNPPVELKTKQSGKIIHLNVHEKDSVEAGDVIAEMEAVADAKTVVRLLDILQEVKKMLNASATESAVNYFDAFYNKNGVEANMGELQSGYQTFVSAFQTFKQYLNTGFYIRKKAMLRHDLLYLQRMNLNLQTQKSLQQEDVSLAAKTFEANQSLSEDKVIAAFEFRNERSKFINKALSIPQLSSGIISNEAAVHEKKKEISQLENEIIQQKNIFTQALHTFIAAVQQWESLYLLKAPIEGSIVFTDFIVENQPYPFNQTVCLINPYHSDYYAQVQIPQQNFGKVKSGQLVLLKLPSYPYQEFGSLKGKLDFISLISTDSGFIGKVNLPGGMLTSQDKKIQYRDGLKANAEIITSDRKLSSRLLNSFTYLFER